MKPLQWVRLLPPYVRWAGYARSRVPRGRVDRNAQNIEAVDGDTIRIGQETIHIIGYDTPEKYGARCPQEALMAAEATDYLQKLVSDKGKQIDIDRQGRDKYKRTLAYVFVDGTDVADLMIIHGVAVWYECPKGRCPKRINWCERIEKMKKYNKGLATF